MLLGIFILLVEIKIEPVHPCRLVPRRRMESQLLPSSRLYYFVVGDRSEARENALTAMLEQWNGKRGDGVSFTPEVEEIEIAFWFTRSY